MHCVKTADRIRATFGIIGRTGPGMRQVVQFGGRSTGRGTFGGEFVVRHCNQWGLYGVGVRQCVKPSELRFRVVRAVRRGIAVLDGIHVAQRELEVWGFVLHFHGIFTMGNAIGSPTVKCFRFVCENLTTFTFGKHIIGKLDSCAFW